MAFTEKLKSHRYDALRASAIRRSIAYRSLSDLDRATVDRFPVDDRKRVIASILKTRVTVDLSKGSQDV